MHGFRLEEDGSRRTIPYAAGMHRSRPDVTGWDSSIVPPLCAVPVCTAVAAVVQHGATPRAVALGLVASAPWLLVAAGVPVPWWIVGPLELAATAGFVYNPVAFDVAPFLLVVTVGVFAAVDSTSVGLAMLAVAGAMMVGFELTDRFDGVAIWILGMSLGWLGGFTIRLQEQAHEVREERATEEERARIARELHDVVAHSLAVTMLNLTGARLALRRDPDEAEAALRQAEESGRQSMADIRRVVGRLGETGMAKPAPGAPDIGDLVREFTEAGLTVTLSIDGDVGAVPPAVGLTMYRIVQESIANVVKHAPGAAADVAIVVERNSACISVRNSRTRRSAARSDGGFGIAGMTERAALVDGTLRAGPAEGDWCVTAELPIGAP
jgi:signal transduction histidine kinase